MTDQEIENELNRAAKILNKVHREAVRRHGNKGFIFFDESGIFHLMSGDVEDGTAGDRQDFIDVSSSVRAQVSGGAW
jgi:hypothetical protein